MTNLLTINATVLSMWNGVWNQPCQITKWGQFKASKWSRQKIETFRGAQDFFGPLNGTSDREGHFGAKKSTTPYWQHSCINIKFFNSDNTVCICPTGSCYFEFVVRTKTALFTANAKTTLNKCFENIRGKDTNSCWMNVYSPLSELRLRFEIVRALWEKE